MEVPEDIREKAKAVRDKLCIESECTFDRGCGCLDALAEALLSERLAQKERDAKIAQTLNGWGADCGRGGHAKHIASAIRKQI